MRTQYTRDLFCFLFGFCLQPQADAWRKGALLEIVRENFEKIQES